MKFNGWRRQPTAQVLVTGTPRTGQAVKVDMTRPCTSRDHRNCISTSCLPDSRRCIRHSPAAKWLVRLLREARIWVRTQSTTLTVIYRRQGVLTSSSSPGNFPDLHILSEQKERVDFQVTPWITAHWRTTAWISIQQASLGCWPLRQ